MNIVEYNLSDDLDFGPKVSVEIDGDLARTLMELASDGAFGDDWTLTDLKPLVHHLLTNRAMAGKRKRDVMLEALKEQMPPLDPKFEEATELFGEKRDSEDMPDSKTDK